MPMYWTFRLHIYSISYSIYGIFSSKLTFKSWISTSEKRGPSCPNSGHGGGGLGDSGNARKKTFFFHWCLPLANFTNHAFPAQSGLKNATASFFVTVLISIHEYLAVNQSHSGFEEKKYFDLRHETLDSGTTDGGISILWNAEPCLWRSC